MIILAGRLVSVHGTVVKMSIVKPLVVQMNFTCTKCRSTVTCHFPDGKYSPPSSCILPSCKSKTFIPVRCEAQTLDFQKIRCSNKFQMFSNNKPNFINVHNFFLFIEKDSKY
jgi:DNA replicative helicase MCM subunit Mcm2 (Cdc46/Mcm family)